MVESAAQLVDHVFPEAPVRQWVLTFPFPLRFLLAANPKALTDVLAVVQRCLSTFLIRRAGFTVASGARTGAVTLIQRFRSALNLNPHRRIVRVLERRGLLIADPVDPHLEFEIGSSLDRIQAASITRDGFASPLRTSGPFMASARACATVSPSDRMRDARH